MSAKLAPLDQSSVSLSYAKVLINLLAKRGVAMAELLAGGEFDHAKLNDGDLDEMISGRQFLLLIERGLSLTGDPNLGVWFGLQLKISTHGSVGYAAPMRSKASMRSTSSRISPVATPSCSSGITKSTNV